MIFQIFTLLLYIDIVTIYTHRITSEEVKVFTYIVMLFLSTLYFKTKIIDILPIYMLNFTQDVERDGEWKSNAAHHKWQNVRIDYYYEGSCTRQHNQSSNIRNGEVNVG